MPAVIEDRQGRGEKKNDAHDPSAIIARRRRNASLAARRPYRMAAARRFDGLSPTVAIAVTLLRADGSWAAPTAQSRSALDSRDAATQLTSGAFNSSSIDTPIFEPWKAVPSRALLESLHEHVVGVVRKRHVADFLDELHRVLLIEVELDELRDLGLALDRFLADIDEDRARQRLIAAISGGFDRRHRPPSHRLSA